MIMRSRTIMDERSSVVVADVRYIISITKLLLRARGRSHWNYLEYSEAPNPLRLIHERLKDEQFNPVS